MQKRNSINVSKITILSLLSAVHVVLSMLVIQAGSYKLTFEHFPVVLSAILFGPWGGMIVGGLGEFVNQMLGFGLMPSTIFFVLPFLARGFLVGIFAKWFPKQVGKCAIREKKTPIYFIILCVVTGIVSSCINTFAIYMHYKMMGDSVTAYAYSIGALPKRLILSAITSVVIGVVIKPVIIALDKSGVLRNFGR